MRTRAESCSSTAVSEVPGDAVTGGPIESLCRQAVRQLVVLRSTYPGWEIQHVIGGPEIDRWTAVLRREMTGRMLAAGVRERVEAPDATALASALSHQVTLLHNARAHTWPD
jgi:hypothetical protein